MQVKRYERHSRIVQWNPRMTESNNRILSCPVKFPILQSNRISVNKTNLHCMAHQMPIVILLFIANSDFNLLSDIEKLLLQQEKQGSRCPLIRFLHDGSLLHDFATPKFQMTNYFWTYQESQYMYRIPKKQINGSIIPYHSNIKLNKCIYLFQLVFNKKKPKNPELILYFSC